MGRVVVICTGGTIAMRLDPASGGSVPVVSGAELLASVPGLDAIAEVEVVDWGLHPASHLTFEQVLAIGRVLSDHLSRPDVDGAVVVQGTDTIEETAFAWDLLPLPAKPVVVVGSMRSASAEGYDGIVNLRNAVAAAAHEALAGFGVLVAMAGELHGADDVQKTHTHAYGTFQSPNLGPIGHVADGEIVPLRARAPVRLLSIPTAAALPVDLLTAVLDSDLGPYRSFADRRPAGVVVAATGGGNTAAGLLELARELMAVDVPVALATRCPSGRVLPGYAFPGGSSTWWDAGALFSGYLNPLKARVALALGIGAGLARSELAGLLERFGGGARSRSGIGP